MVVATTAKNTCRAPRSAATTGGFALVDPALDVLDHHDGVVDDQPMASTRASRVRG